MLSRKKLCVDMDVGLSSKRSPQCRVPVDTFLVQLGAFRGFARGQCPAPLYNDDRGEPVR